MLLSMVEKEIAAKIRRVDIRAGSFKSIIDDENGSFNFIGYFKDSFG